MSEHELYTKMHTLKELEMPIEEAQEEAEAIRDLLKDSMKDSGTDELRAGTYKARYTEVTSQRFDVAAFKREHNDIYKRYVKTTTSRRFTFA